MKTIETIQTDSGPVRVRCYTQPGDGRDRFTILLVDEPSSFIKSRLRECLGLSGWGSGLPGRHLGKRVPFADMPDHLKQRITRNK